MSGKVLLQRSFGPDEFEDGDGGRSRGTSIELPPPGLDNLMQHFFWSRMPRTRGFCSTLSLKSEVTRICDAKFSDQRFFQGAQDVWKSASATIFRSG